MSGLKIPVDILTEVSPLFIGLKNASKEELIKKYDPSLLYQLERMLVSQIAIFSANERDGSIPRWVSVLEKIQSIPQKKLALVSAEDLRVHFVMINNVEETAKERTFEWLDRLYQEVEETYAYYSTQGNDTDEMVDFWENVLEKLKVILAFYPTPIWGRTPDHFVANSTIYALARNHEDENNTFFFDKGIVERAESDLIYQVEKQPIWQNKVHVRFAGFDYLFPILAVSPYLLREAELQFLVKYPAKLEEVTQGLETEMAERLKNALQWHIQKTQAN